MQSTWGTAAVAAAAAVHRVAVCVLIYLVATTTTAANECNAQVCVCLCVGSALKCADDQCTILCTQCAHTETFVYACECVCKFWNNFMCLVYIYISQKARARGLYACAANTHGVNERLVAL